MQLSDFNYDLPPELIANYPLVERTESRLLCLDSKTGKIIHQQFKDVLALLQPNDLLIMNNTRVIPARLFGHKVTGGKVEILIERITGQYTALAHVRASKSPAAGSMIQLQNNITITVLGRQHDLFELKFLTEQSVLDVLAVIGHMPLPPYIARADEKMDQERYQTVYAEKPGAVAAPTAGLHFDENLLKKIKAKGVQFGFVTLHVGAGTFQPVRVQNIKDHVMHAEYIEVSPAICEQIRQTKLNGGRIVAVGTTTLRSLETASQNGEIKPYYGDTQIFIYPGFEFCCVDVLVTNFHLPQSTLLMLVSAFTGYENIMQAYKVAVAEKYRFFSYGDAMWLTLKK